MSLEECSAEFKSMFREYDIRGRVSENELNNESVYRIVKAYGKFLNENGIKDAVVGYDNRECSVGFADAANRALRDMGINVIFVGWCITPVVYYAQYLFKSEGAVMITASHNPNGWSGFKFGKGYSRTLEAPDIKVIFDYVINMEIENNEKQGNIETVNVWKNYVDEVVSRIKMGPHKPRVVLDAGNGAAGLFAYEVFQRLGCTTFQLNCDPDMNYPHYFPNPSDVKAREKLKELVVHPYVKADLGMSFDGDGDRLGVVDENGNNMWSDIVLAILAKQLLEKKPGSTVVFDVKCSKALEEVIEQNGGVPVMWITGHSYIKSKRHELEAELAGERSGHIFIGGDDYFGFDDAIFAGAKVIEYLSHNTDSISTIISKFPQYITSPEIKPYCDDVKKYEIIKLLVEDFKKAYPGKVNDINGARVEFENGWGLVRASSNLPEFSIIIEAKDRETLMEIHAIFKKMLKKYPEISEEWHNDIE